MNISRRITGDRLSAEAAVLMKNGVPRELSGATVAYVMIDATGTAKITEASTYVTAQATRTFTADTDRDEIKRTAHGLMAGDEVVFSTTDTLPAGLATGTRYFATDITPHRFKVQLTPADPPVNITDVGTGAHSYYQVGYVEYAYQAADVDTAGQYKAWFTVTNTTKDHHPNTAEGMSVEIVSRGS